MMTETLSAGVQALKRGDALGALPYLERACRDRPDDFRAHVALGVAYGECGRLDDAVRRMRHAVHLQPGAAQVHYNLGLALERAGRAREAAASIERALALDPEHPKALEVLHRIRSVPRECGHCRAPVSLDDVFCPKCGQPWS